MQFITRFGLAGLFALSGAVMQAATAPVLTGQGVTLALTTDGTEPLVYEWFKDGVALVGARASTYVITSFQAASAGVYSVLVSNSAGSVMSDFATLELLAPPVITTQPADQTVLSGKPVTFAVTATGLPAPTYQWLRNGAVLVGATDSSYTIAKAVIGNSGHSGTYSVVVTNSVGTVTSNGAVLTVTKPDRMPAFKTQPASQTVVAGSEVTFAVSVTASPTATNQWRKNGVAIAGATGVSYVIASVTAADAGTYSLVASNSVGTATSKDAVLTVNPRLPAHADFNGDGKSDILWQNILTGDHQLWFMAGTAVASKVTLSKMATDWEVVGVSDFNTDGRNDILWQNLVTRESALWLMSGATLVGGASLGVAPTGMLMAGTGDFNADGLPDILWRNIVTGEYSIRFMDGIIPGASVSLGAGPAGWSVVATGDFNGEGKPDILWEKISDGRYARVWLMNGSAFVSSNDLAVQATGWSLGGTGDFNGDGQMDLLWEHATTGQRKVGLMLGLTQTSEISLPTSPPEWIMAN